MEKRTWHYVQEPIMFDMMCDKCEGRNIAWSEYVEMIWCYDCEIDTKGYGIFDGPIPFHLSEMLGMSFDRYNMETGKIDECILKDGKMKWIPMTEEKVNKKWKPRKDNDGLE